MKKIGDETDFGAETLLEEHIASHRLKSTKERQDVLRAFLSAERHVTAEELHVAMKRQGASIGLATVYRALNLFCECGLAERHQFGDGHARYELTYNVGHHDHLICTQCHAVIEFENLMIEKLQNKVAQEHRFVIKAHKLEIYGSCEKCVKAGDQGRRVKRSS